MLLLDRLRDLVPGRYGRAVKAVTANESHQGGSHGLGSFPPSLLVDALGQLAITVLSAGARTKPRLWFLSALEAMRWEGMPVAGDVLEMEADVLRTWRGTSRVGVTATIKGAACLRGVMVLTAGPEGAASPDGGGYEAAVPAEVAA
jgi:3-hydroxyacyl-[acyl-carrier-protein] dehydratase